MKFKFQVNFKMLRCIPTADCFTIRFTIIFFILAWTIKVVLRVCYLSPQLWLWQTKRQPQRKYSRSTKHTTSYQNYFIAMSLTSVSSQGKSQWRIIRESCTGERGLKRHLSQRPKSRGGYKPCFTSGIWCFQNFGFYRRTLVSKHRIYTQNRMTSSKKQFHGLKESKTLVLSKTLFNSVLYGFLTF